MLNYIDVVIIVGSMLFVIGVGVFAGRKRGDTAHGYFLGGNRMPWWIIGTAFVATGISSEQMIGTVGIAYNYGMGIAQLGMVRAALLRHRTVDLHTDLLEEPGDHGTRLLGRPLRAGRAARSIPPCCWRSTCASTR